MIQVIQSNYLLWAICFIMFSATWNIDFLNCTCTLLEDGTKGSQSVAKLKTWVLSPKSYCESLFKLEIWRVLEVLSDWPGTCKVFSQVSPITFFFLRSCWATSIRTLKTSAAIGGSWCLTSTSGIYWEIGRHKGQTNPPSLLESVKVRCLISPRWVSFPFRWSLETYFPLKPWRRIHIGQQIQWYSTSK